jgi:tRNA uracil 4-sulfurtransferase
MNGIVLLSGGIDSPVAAHLMRGLGMDLVFVHFSDGEDPEKIKRLARIIDPEAKVIFIDHTPTQESIRKNCDTRYQCVLCKRAMYRQCEEIARREGADSLVTGENLGQVASQTLQNLAVLDDAVSLVVHRPLLGYDKQEIIALARRIGTYEISIHKAPACRFVPRRPLTGARLEKVEMEEARLCA